MSQMSETILQTNTDLIVKIAKSSVEVEQALRLRYQVFVEEEKNQVMRNDQGLETDAFDEFCDHLIVQDERTSEVIGTYRLLTGEVAMRNIGFYSETEFDLTTFEAYKPRSLELGRSCIAPAYRGGKAIQMLWEGIADYISVRQCDYLIGCASLHMKSILELQEIYSFLIKRQILTNRFGIKPLDTHRIDELQWLEIMENDIEIFRKLPPLMKGYQRLGAEIGGDPAFDAIFGTVDFFIVLDKQKMTKRYRRHFLNS